jgi:hypothetical protein
MDVNIKYYQECDDDDDVSPIEQKKEGIGLLL